MKMNHIMKVVVKTSKKNMMKEQKKILGNNKIKTIIMMILLDLVVAYLTNDRLDTVKRRELYVSWGICNIFLTPAHDWIHN